MRNNILITGVCGEIGQELVNNLSSNKNRKIIGIDIKTPSKIFRQNMAKFVKADVQNTTLINRIIKIYKIRTVFHFAAILSTSAERDPYLAHKVNVEATVGLLNISHNCAKKSKFKMKFIFPSSIAAYGISDMATKNRVKKIKEDQYNSPITIYGINKLYCEHVGIYYSNNYNLLKSSLSYVDFRALRFPGIISATTMPTGGTSDYAPEMINAASKGKPSVCFVRPDTKIPFMTMSDATLALKLFASVSESKLKSRVYNVGGFSVSAEELEKEVIRYFPKANISYSVDRNRQKIIDSWPEDLNDKKAKKDWGWKPEHTFKKAFKDYLIPNIQNKHG